MTLLQVSFKTLSLGIEAHRTFSEKQHNELQGALVGKGVPVGRAADIAARFFTALADALKNTK